jgi:hypothetical protein
VSRCNEIELTFFTSKPQDATLFTCVLTIYDGEDENVMRLSHDVAYVSSGRELYSTRLFQVSKERNGLTFKFAIRLLPKDEDDSPSLFENSDLTTGKLLDKKKAGLALRPARAAAHIGSVIRKRRVQTKRVPERSEPLSPASEWLAWSRE